jgi:uncharacterized alkaline shock family protein YloU
VSIADPREATSFAPVGSRGMTDIADRVVEKIAGRAACEVEQVHAPPPRGLARITGPPNEADADADVHVTGSTVQVEVRVAVSYPAPIHTVAQEVQRAVRDRVQSLTGLEVTAVRVDIASLSTSESRPPRVV